MKQLESNNGRILELTSNLLSNVCGSITSKKLICEKKLEFFVSTIAKNLHDHKSKTHLILSQCLLLFGTETEAREEMKRQNVFPLLFFNVSNVESVNWMKRINWEVTENSDSRLEWKDVISKSIIWSKDLHPLFPSKIKSQVLQLLLIRINKSPFNLLSRIPRGIFFLIIEFVASGFFVLES